LTTYNDLSISLIIERLGHWGVHDAKAKVSAAAWHNGSGGYGFRLSARDRDAYLKREWGSVLLHLPGEMKPIAVNLDKDSLWNGTCRELINSGIAHWLHRNGLAPCSKGNPPKFDFLPRSSRDFDVQPI
jgi:hypothetical protein